MNNRQFRTYEVVAAMYGMPDIIRVHHAGLSTLQEAFDRLAEVTEEIAGTSPAPGTAYGRSMAGWMRLAPAMKPALIAQFPALAAEPMPDKLYWTNPTLRRLDIVKAARLDLWLDSLEQRYGATLEVPPINVEVDNALKEASKQRG